jgi:long-chain acyl-CoA synthetase
MGNDPAISFHPLRPPKPSTRATVDDMERESLAGLLDDFARHGRECAYVQPRGYRTERWTYRQVAELAFRFARELDSRAIGKGERVMIWGGNCAEWVAAFFGCALRGIVAVPMDDAAAPDFAGRVCAQVNARLLVCSRKRSRQAGGGVPSVLLDDLPELVAKHPADPSPPLSVDRTDPLEIIFTSGTTAEPKGVVISHGNALANLAPLETEIQKYLKYERWVHPVRFLNLLPLSHVFGQFLGMFLPPLLAATVLFRESLNPSSVIETVRRERVSVVVAVPRMLESLRNKIEGDLESEQALERWRRALRQGEGRHFVGRWWMFRDIHRQFGWKFWAFICGGAALDRETEEFWRRLGYAVIQGYGLTETTSLVSVNHPFQLSKGSIGKVLPGREVKLADDGEILVRGGGVASGYWKGGGLEAVVGEEGWYRTGDVGVFDADGNLYFKGRKKEVLVTPAGMNVYPQDLEAALRRQPAVRDCVVIGLDRAGNAEPCAVLILRDAADPAEVVERANQELAEYQRMREWAVWAESDFPRTTGGKPRIRFIRDALARQRASPGEPPAGASPLADLITKISGRPVARLRPDANLEDDLHLGSLERVELLSALEDRYQVTLSDNRFSAVRTVADLEQMLASSAAVGASAAQGRMERAKYHYPRWALRWPVTWIRTAAYYLLVRPAILVLAWPRVEGREHLRGVKGPVLVVSNHIDDVDVGFVKTALPPRLRHRLATAAGGEALQVLRTPPPERRFIGRAYDRLKWTSGVALLNLFPLPREAAFLRSFAYAGECVDRGYSVLVFPEGHHTTDGRLRPFRAGIGLLANHLRVPVVPVRIDGLFEVKQTGRKFAVPGKIRVHIGKPMRFAPETDPEEIAADLEKRVAEL